MKRLASFLLVSFLVASTGGILELVQPEPCPPAESSSEPSDGSCPPTCLRCHCGRLFDYVGLIFVADAPPIAPEWPPLARIVTLPVPDDILHVPRPTRG